jgi:hypothetical protein
LNDQRPVAEIAACRLAPVIRKRALDMVCRSRRFWLAGMVFAIASGTCARVWAQPVQNPRFVEFDPSTEHNVTLSTGQPAVSRYDFEIYLAGAAAPFYTMSLGKPAIDTDGKVRYDFSAQIASWPLPGGTYESRVTAVGPNGTGRSDPSNQFVFVACTITLPTTSFETNWPGVAISVPVTTPSGCSWSASTAASWLTLTIAGGAGSGSVSVMVAPNQTRDPRTGVITVGTASAVIHQTEKPGNYPLAPVGLKAIPRK